MTTLADGAPEKIHLALTLVQRGFGAQIMDNLTGKGMSLHVQCPGRGTAPSEIMDLIGLDDSAKDVIVSMGLESAAQLVVHEMRGALTRMGRGKGMMMFLSPAAVQNLLSVMLQRPGGELVTGGDAMSQETRHALILITLNLGYTDQVMHAAHKAGATGGTVVKGRFLYNLNLEGKLGLPMQEEKEILLILTDLEKRNAIMEAVNTAYGLRTKAQAVIAALPVDCAFKL